MSTTQAPPQAAATTDAEHPKALWPVILLREIHVRLTDKNFLISTGATMAIMLAVFAFQGVMAGQTHEVKVATAGQEATDLAGRIGAAAHAADDALTVTPQRVDGDDAARTAVQEGRADAWLHPGPDGWVLTTKSDTPSTALLTATRDTVRQEALTRNAAKAGTTADALRAGSTVTTQRLSGGDGTSEIVRMIAGAVLAVTFYMVSLLFGMAIAQSVVEEKQSRIVEIIASSVPLRQLLLGKVLGNTCLALAQTVLFVAVGLIGLQLTPYKQYVGLIGGPVGWYLAFFLVGFVALACLWAVAGSIASRHEDLQTTSQPMMIAIMVAFFGGMFAGNSGGTLGTLLSFVPVTSSVAMPMRLLAGDVPLWQPVVAVLLDLAFAAVAVVVCERAYRRSIMASGPVSWRTALTAER